MNLYESITNNLSREHQDLPVVHSMIYQAVENVKNRGDLPHTITELSSTENEIVYEIKMDGKSDASACKIVVTHEPDSCIDIKAFKFDMEIYSSAILSKAGGNPVSITNITKSVENCLVDIFKKLGAI